MSKFTEEQWDRFLNEVADHPDDRDALSSTLTTMGCPERLSRMPHFLVQWVRSLRRCGVVLEGMSWRGIELVAMELLEMSLTNGEADLQEAERLLKERLQLIIDKYTRKRAPK